MSCRRILSVAAAGMFALPLPAVAQAFEGVITQRSLDLADESLYNLVNAGSDDEPEFDSQTDWFRYVAAKLFDVPVDELPGGEAEALTIHIRGPMLRYDQGSGPGYVVTDLSTGVTRLVDPSTRSYIEYTAEDIQAAAEAAAAAASEAEGMMSTMGLDPAGNGDEGDADGVHLPPKTQALGLTETVNGFSATAYAAEAGNQIGRGWCAGDASEIREALERLSDQMVGFDEEENDPSDGPALEDLICETGLPVQTKILTFGDWGGLSYSVTEILSVERTPQSDDLFAVPAGFTKRTMSTLWR